MLPDENVFVLPGSWARKAEPFRDLRAAPKVAIDVAATRTEVEKIRASRESRVQELLDHPDSHPTLIHLARLHHSGQDHNPAGAAALLAVYSGAVQGLRERDREHHSTVLIDDLVLTHGLPFAADAGNHLIFMSADPRNGISAQNRVLNAGTQPILARLRRHLAAAPDDIYAEAVTLLSDARKSPVLHVRIAASYLLPTEQEWVHEDITALPGTRLPHGMGPILLASATTPDDVDAILAATRPEILRNHSHLLWTVVANLGPSAVGPLTKQLDKDDNAAMTKRLVGFLSALPTDEAFTVLVDRLHRKHVEQAVHEAMDRFPVRAARVLTARAKGADTVARTYKDLLRGHLRSHPELLEHTDVVGPETTASLVEIGRDLSAVPVAGHADLPGVLVTPPWAKRTRATAPPVISGLAPPLGLALRWAQGEREEWAHAGDVGWGRSTGDDWSAAIADRIAPDAPHPFHALVLMVTAPPELVRPHLASFTPPEHPNDLRSTVGLVQRLLARFGDDAIGCALRIVQTKPVALAAALLPVEGAEIAAHMATWSVRAASLRPVARQWMERHPEAAACGLVPAALGKPGKTRTIAEAHLRALDRAGHHEAVRSGAIPYGDEAVAAVDILLDADPLERLPAKIPPRPAWLDPAHLPEVLLRDRSAALPTEAVGNLCTMLAICTPDDAYAGVDVVKAATDPASLAELVWGLLERWQGAGFPRADDWVLIALAHLGDDETARRLARLIRSLPREGGTSRSVALAALDALAAIGSGVALLHLHNVAEKATLKRLKVRAHEKIDEVALGLGLSPEQLADRLVPDFGLDSKGSMVLDYGPRRFTVGFDEQLRPVVAYEDGSHRKIPPRPSATDDPDTAPAAYAAFKGLKKDVAIMAADQIRRFERAMVGGRRWTAAEHRTVFIEHPLLRYLTRRLIWATFDDSGAVTGSFRVAEDHTLAAVDDSRLALPDDTVVGIAHPVHLGDRTGTWSELFTEHEILQPFPQLARGTWALTPGEKAATVLRRLDGLVIGTGRLLGLAHRGWERGEVADVGASAVMCRPTPGTHVIVINLRPGIIARDAMAWDEQTVDGVWISSGPTAYPDAKGELTFSVLDDVTASELLRDLEHLRSRATVGSR